MRKITSKLTSFTHVVENSSKECKESVSPSFSFFGTKIVSTFIVLFVVAVSAFGQGDPQFSQNMYSRLTVNPAYAGSTGGLCATALYRNQWVGFQGQPTTGSFSLDGLASPLHGGVGLVVNADKIGLENSTDVRLSYAYRMRLFTNGRLALGLSAGLLNKTINADGFVSGSNTPDPNIPAGTPSSNAVDVGFGAYFNTNDFYVGISSLHLNQPTLEYTGASNGGGIKYQVQRTYYIMAGYNYPLTREITLKPSVFIKTYTASTQVDFNTTVLYNNLVWAGVSYRLEDAVALMAGVNVTEQFKIGYSYDITTSSIKTYSSGSHEIMLRYCFKLDNRRPAYSNRTIRFL